MMFSKKRKPGKNSGLQNVLQNPKILEVNLIRDEVRISFDWKKNASFIFLSLFVVAIFIIEVYFGLDQWEQKELVAAQALEEQTAKVSGEVSEMKKTAAPALAYRSKAVAVSQLLDNHVYWTNFFSWLEKKTLSSVYYQGFEGENDGSYNLEAVASSYAEASWQAQALASDPFVLKAEIKEVATVSDSQGAPEGIGFTINLRVDPKIFKR